MTYLGLNHHYLGAPPNWLDEKYWKPLPIRRWKRKFNHYQYILDWEDYFIAYRAYMWAELRQFEDQSCSDGELFLSLERQLKHLLDKCAERARLYDTPQPKSDHPEQAVDEALKAEKGVAMPHKYLQRLAQGAWTLKSKKFVS